VLQVLPVDEVLLVSAKLKLVLWVLKVCKAMMVKLVLLVCQVEWVPEVK
jgi:hypothetical protein